MGTRGEITDRNRKTNGEKQRQTYTTEARLCQASHPVQARQPPRLAPAENRSLWESRSTRRPAGPLLGSSARPSGDGPRPCPPRGSALRPAPGPETPGLGPPGFLPVRPLERISLSNPFQAKTSSPPWQQETLRISKIRICLRTALVLGQFSDPGSVSRRVPDLPPIVKPVGRDRGKPHLPGAAAQAESILPLTKGSGAIKVSPHSQVSCPPGRTIGEVCG